jgi:hypothetical protein
MVDENKVTADLRQFIAARIAKGQVLDVDKIALLFLATSEAAQDDAYKGVSAASIGPQVKAVVAEFLLRSTPEGGT